MNICYSNRALSLEVLEFMHNVGDIKEESITDYLVWKWRELDKRFNYLSVSTFNHDEESTKTGADFDLELWLVGRTSHISLAVQAKKFIRPHDSYVNRLKYPNGSKKQMNMLLSYAASTKKLPFYFIYSAPGSSTSTMCGMPDTGKCGIFMADAKVMEKFADGKHGKRVSRDDILSKSNPFHCMFCCPLGPGDKYFEAYFRRGRSEAVSQPNDALPQYVQELMLAPSEQPLNEKVIRDLSNREWVRFRAVGVYDLRADA